MSDGKDQTGLGVLRLPIFLGAAIFFLSQAIESFSRIAVEKPTEIIANNNVTLITQRSGGLIPNGNLVLEIIFGVGMTIGTAVAFIGFVAGLLFYLTKKDEVFV